MPPAIRRGVGRGLRPAGGGTAYMMRLVPGLISSGFRSGTGALARTSSGAHVLQ